MKHAHFPIRRFAALVSLYFAAGVCHAQNLLVTPDKPDGIYQIGEPVHWQIQWKGDGPVTEADYTIKEGGQTQSAKGTVPLTDGSGTLNARLDKPGSLLAEIRVTSADNKSHKASGGALIAPDKITPAATRPDDFDQFWEAKLKQLAAVPPNPQLEPGESNKSNVDYWKITLDNIHGTHIQGQLARPKEGEKFPALLIPQWAGVYPLQKSWATDRAAEGWLVLNIEAHDLPIDESEQFYKDQFAGPLKDYWAIGNDDRDTSYFLRMYLSCVQAANYLMSRPDWDGKTLVVTGTSQGGQQTLMIAGLYPKFTAALALVPAGCDMLGPNADRAPGWPAWYSQIHGKDPQKVREASRYYDVENFAPHIKCPVLVAMGLIDQVCPPAATFAAVNQIESLKEILVLPKSEHQDSHNSQRPYYQRSSAWLAQLRRGQSPPLKDGLATAETAEPSSPTSHGAKESSQSSDKAADASSAYLPPTRETYLKLAAETEAALHRNILDPWFPRCVDNEHGGFYSDYARDWQPNKSEGKFSVFQGRMTWITAEVALRRPDLKEQFLPYTKHGAKFLGDVMWDNQSGGIYWGLDDDGKITPSFGDDKQLYGIGFCLYAAANSYRATQDPATLDLAQRIFRWADQHAHDDHNGGYFEWLKRDGTPIQPDPNKKQPDLRSGLPVGGKSMNTHIHYLETLAQLYQVWPDAAVRDRLEDVLSMVRDKICKEPGVMNLYFTFDWQPTSDRDSYGHDIETAYLLTDAAEVLGQANNPKTEHMARLLVDHCLQTGWDAVHGGVYQEGPMLGKPDALAKDWWVQVESLNALLLMHEKYGAETDKYFKAFQQQWQFIQNFQFDHEFPGVIESVQPDGTPTTQDKGRMWKAAYHDGRALLNVTDRLKKLAEQK